MKTNIPLHNNRLLKWYVVFFFSTFLLKADAQKIQTQLVSTDTAIVHIITATPDAFPTVSLVFKAQTKSGYPLWNLEPDRILVRENQSNCTVHEFLNLNKERSINIGLVVDHSGSMLSDNYNQLNEYLIFYYYEALKRISPLTAAKKAIRHFLNGMDFNKDSVCIVGFSSSVDVVTKVSNEKEMMVEVVNQMNEEGTTAFYDALIASIDKIKQQSGIKIIIALTDGDDNASQHTLDDVIQKANDEEIPVYVIALGQVNMKPLKALARKTQGTFYYSKASSSLINVYEQIKQDIQALYEVKYISPNLGSGDTLREIQLSFNVDSVYSKQEGFSYLIPQEIRTYLKVKENEKKQQHTYWYASLTITAVSIGGIILYRYKKNNDNKS